MARRKKIDIDRDALELLALTMRGTKQRFLDAASGEYPVEAALVSASVSLLKLVEAFKAAKGDDEAEGLEQLRAEFEAKGRATKAAHAGKPAIPAQPALDPDELRRAYGLSEQVAP